MTKEKIQDFTIRVTTANKTEMIVILYDIAITYLQDAVDALSACNHAEYRRELGRARNTLRELQNSVDTSMDLGMNLLKLYVYCNKELTKGYMDFDETPIFHVMAMLIGLRDAYKEAGKADKSGPVMDHVETICSGYTYNKYLMKETVSTGEYNRGLLA